MQRSGRWPEDIRCGSERQAARARVLTTWPPLCTLAEAVPIALPRPYARTVAHPGQASPRGEGPWHLTLVSALVVLPGSLGSSPSPSPSFVAAQTGTISGKVTDEAGGAPLEAARIVLTGTTRIETTNREGIYTFRAVAPGSYQVRALRVGYRPATDSVTVADGGHATADFLMAAAPVQLDEIVTTATGEQRKLEVGNVVTTIDAAKITETAPITEFSNLLSGRAAGVQVLKSSGTTGEGTRIRIRGSNSISLSNEPLYYLDGVRLESAASSTTLNVGGFSDQSSNQSPSRINDIDPDDIESIEIVKGPAAATLYGIQASNGVVRITTKHGRRARRAGTSSPRSDRFPTTISTPSTTTGASIPRSIRPGSTRASTASAPSRASSTARASSPSCRRTSRSTTPTPGPTRRACGSPTARTSPAAATR